MLFFSQLPDLLGIFEEKETTLAARTTFMDQKMKFWFYLMELERHIAIIMLD